MYTQHFGLSEFPFNLTSDPRFFYGNRVYQEALTGVRYGIKLRHGLIVLTGETGTGKTSLVRFVKERCESNIHPVVISNPPAEFSALLRLIMVGLGLPEPAADCSAAIEDLKRFLKEQLEKNHVAAVLIDEAQDLDAAALREIAALSELRWDNSRLLQIVLVGRRELETSLNRPELHSVKESAALWCRLEPLRTDEIAAYIDRRLARAGYKGKGLFERAAVEQIAVYSAGIPGQINVICDNALLSAYAASQKTVSLETVHKVFHTVQFRGACEVSPAFVEDDVEARLAAEEEPPMSETDREPHRPDDEKRHLRWPTPRKPGAASLFSLSTLAAAAGILFLAAAAGMLYIDHNEVSRANPSEEGSTRQEPSHPLGTGGSAGAVVYPDVAHEDQAASPSENGGGLHAMSSPAGVVGAAETRSD
jgi:general secretion pathway protein A